MNAREPIYLEFIDFVAAAIAPEEVAKFHPSPEAQSRLSELLEREREGALDPEQAAELAHYIELEHILRMAKAKARLILANQT